MQGMVGRTVDRLIGDARVFGISGESDFGLVEKLGDYPYWNIAIAEPGESLLY